MSTVLTRWRAITDRHRLGRWRRPSVVAGLPLVPVVIGGALAAGGVLVIFTTLLPAASGARATWVVRATDVAAIAASVVILRFLRGHQRRWPQLAMLAATALITVAVLASGGGSTATAYACVYYLALVYGFFALSRLAAVVHLLITLSVGVPALAVQPGVGPGEQLVLWGVALLLCALVAWLVQAVDDAETDPLTGLPDRRGVERALGRAVVLADEDVQLSFALLDLDHFKGYNESMGTAAGDRLLVEVATAWSRMVPDDALLGRYSGDAFAVVLPSHTAAQATDLAEQLRRALPAGVSCSAGTAAWAPQESPSMLAARTDGAVWTAKHLGRARTHEHQGTGTDGHAVRQALARTEFAVHFQPVVELASGRVCGAEALVRWVHPTRGLLPPHDFLPEAERSGSIVELGGWVLREACHQATTWVPTADGTPMHVAVNASGRELQDPRYASAVEEALLSSGLAPDRLIVELVEDDYDIESLHLATNLHRLSALGVRTAIDDFGTGHSSLDRLRRLGADLLKVDRTFIGDITDPDQDAPLVSAVLAMAHAMGLRVVAEGVETAAQVTWLRRRGCEMAQGYLFGHPSPWPPTTDAGSTTDTSASSSHH